MDPQFTGKPLAGLDIEQMPETPHRGSHHRRAHSDTSFRLPNLDDLLLFDPSDLDLTSLPSPSPTAGGAPMPVDSSSKSSDESNKPRPSSKPSAGPIGHHFRSLSVDSDFFDGLGLGDEKVVVGEKRVHHHRHSNSMDGSFEADSAMAIMDGVKTAMGPDRLAELSLIDPKRAKRILANRQSAARSKERKLRYTSELERKVQTLQSEATTLSAQVTLLQRDTTGLTAENKELKLRLQAMEEQSHLRDALNEALREEVQRLKIAAGQLSAASSNPFNRGLPPQYSSQQPALHHFGSPPTQQQLHVMQSSPSNQTSNGQPHPSFMDFNQGS
ncbi:hypothetical protein I3843_16G014000 [Carya illinoinensis]|uniref:BZIP domain-containing protein n=1 Tax=Carya illinoinensis TaxID=32201 RepID=A0A8T1N6G1_CARIL|nr:transcription factor VIP1-like [Carya illinoinensis]KAG2663114.1 hypothetical protein I3760_16G012300 [Carya illinoinensis]KAG6624263.1 hypothetical protein CIPAW_16G014000 [Carya illinoinensis]KAG6671628.1 hypothetical protein I3842_16G012700 [Carya illinoinensis]KAG7940969.1 hypothetical protein I3843_16G014000 [Carya illinoinensis]